jgi:surface protein
MKLLNLYISEKLVVNKDYKDLYTCEPKTFEELRKIIEDRYKKFGPGTKQKPIDFNDVDVSNVNSFYNKDKGIFRKTKFEYIDISNWNVSNVKDMNRMFYGCEQLKSVGDLSNWSVSKVENMYAMFYGCAQLKSVGDLSNWDVSNVEYMGSMFYECRQLKSVGDLSNWNVSNVRFMYFMFAKSGITNKPKWHKR